MFQHVFKLLMLNKIIKKQNKMAPNVMINVRSETLTNVKMTERKRKIFHFFNAYEHTISANDFVPNYVLVILIHPTTFAIFQQSSTIY